MNKECAPIWIAVLAGGLMVAVLIKVLIYSPPIPKVTEPATQVWCNWKSTDIHGLTSAYDCKNIKRITLGRGEPVNPSCATHCYP